jgi:GT2 family glycosyltransferase
MKRCDIIIPVWNQLDVTKECIESILNNTGYPYRLIIIDNGSDKEAEEYLRTLQQKEGLEAVLIRNNDNKGFVKAVNRGIETSDAAYVCIANNDIVVTGGWLEEMVNIMETDRRIGLVNPSSNMSGENPGKGETIEEYAKSLKASSGRFQELYTCRGFCMLLARAVLDALGALDEIYHIGYFDDTDYCKRAQAKGFKTVRAKGCYVYHKGNVSFKTLNDNNVLFKRNEKVFFGRWGRQVRVGYFIENLGLDSGKRIDDIAHKVARGGHQISIFIKKGLGWPVTLDHYDIRKAELGPLFFRAVSVYKIFKRRKKKKIDVVLTDDPVLGHLLKITNPFHGSEVLVRAGADELMDAVREQSKIF